MAFFLRRSARHWVRISSIGLLTFAFTAPCLTNPAQLSDSNTVKQQPTQQIHWNFHDADIRAVINTVASLTGKSFVIDPRIQGKVSFISTHPMSQDEAYTAFLSMLRVLNFAAVPTNHIIKIIPIMDARSMGMASKTQQMLRCSAKRLVQMKRRDASS